MRKKGNYGNGVLTACLAATALLAWPVHASDVIALPCSPTAVEQYAAEELRDGLERCTGREWFIQDEGQAVKPAFFVGATRAALEARGNVPYVLDEILMQTVGNHVVVLDGHPDRGPIYAVHQYLEDCMGVRWWTATESSYPFYEGDTMPSANLRYAPPFKYRETFYLSNYDASFKVRGKSNFSSRTRYIFPPVRQELPSARMGGSYSLFFYEGRRSAYHSFFEVLPPRLYFAAHPEWYSYSEKAGKRTASQLCTSNEEMSDAYVEAARKLLRTKPGTTFMQVSQNDAEGFCECPACKAIYSEEGAVSGSYLRFVNRVAGALASEFPDLVVDTFAYQFTRKAPKKTVPAKNVVVRLCDFECGANVPLDSSPASYTENRAFLRDLEDWSRVAGGRLYVWDYLANFRQYMLPRPNMRAIVSNIRLFAAYGAVGIFEQGDALCAAGSFAPLKQYLTSHLVWNPAADDRRLVSEFLSGYYGQSAAPMVAACLELLEREASNPSNPPMTCCERECRNWLTARGHLEALRLINEAVAAAERDGPRHVWRVRRERLSLEHAVILWFDGLKAFSESNGIIWPMRDATRSAAVERWISEVRAFGVLAAEETTNPMLVEDYFQRLREGRRP